MLDETRTAITKLSPSIGFFEDRSSNLLHSLCWPKGRLVLQDAEGIICMGTAYRMQLRNTGILRAAGVSMQCMSTCTVVRRDEGLLGMLTRSLCVAETFRLRHHRALLDQAMYTEVRFYNKRSMKFSLVYLLPSP